MIVKGFNEPAAVDSFFCEIVDMEEAAGLPVSAPGNAGGGGQFSGASGSGSNGCCTVETGLLCIGCGAASVPQTGTVEKNTSINQAGTAVIVFTRASPSQSCQRPPKEKVHEP